MTSFHGKIALVTGAASGIGETTARMLHERGAQVMFAVHTADQAARVTTDPALAGARACAVDVTDPGSVAHAVASVREAFGGLHLAVNAAAITGPAATPLSEYDLADWNAVIAADLTGVFLSMKHEIPAILASGGGSIVNLSSANGQVGIPGMAAYTTAKHGVLGLTRTAALELADKGVRVNAVAPGYVATPKVLAAPQEILDGFRASHPMQRLAEPAEVAELILFLLSDRAGFATGGTYSLDGGYTAQ